ncbi:DUF1993 family protein [Novosphingobium sp.]|uniref:DUF1993 domain-containing protein n=1 Tax=Novosphingobium sp. TaxID=1874826 RepID=UPI00260191E4|nr:DUF1993 domain-containing protein [Novosphingobium sp.]
MTFSLYDATVPAFLQQLRALDGLVARAEAFCAEGHATETEIQEARIADMLPFAWQVRWGPGHSTMAIECCRSGSYSPDLSPPPATFAEQRAMLGHAVAELEALSGDALDSLADRTVVFSVPARGVEMPFTARDFLLSFSLPNFYFHVTTAYNLLRARGLPIGKRDYLGQPRLKDQT